MENIIQVIVAIIIIYAILSPALKKKTPQQKYRPPEKRIPGQGRSSQRSAPPSTSDVFEELFGLKIPKTNDQIPQQEDQSEYPQIKTVDYDTDFKTNYVDYDTTLKTDYKNLETTTSIPNIDYDNVPFDKTMPKEALMQKDVMKTVTFFKLNNKAYGIKKMLTSKNSLRDIILASEIINKPKALRR